MPPSKLKAVDPKSAEPSRPKVLIYGKPGVGKTWTALDFPSVYYIDTEGGADMEHYTDKLRAAGGVYFGPEQGSLSFEAVLKEVRLLATEKHSFRTVVIDSITKLYAIAISDEAERIEGEGKKNEFGADKKPATRAMRSLVAWLTRLDMNAVLIAHEKAEWGRNAKTGDREEIGATFDCWDKLEYELHLVLRIMKTGPSRRALVRKSRLLGFPEEDVFPWSYQDFAGRYGKSVIEKVTKEIMLATPEQLNELDRLLEVIKLPDGQIEKWLKAANADDFADVDTDKMAKILAHLQEKLAQPKPQIQPKELAA